MIFNSTYTQTQKKEATIVILQGGFGLCSSPANGQETKLDLAETRQFGRRPKSSHTFRLKVQPFFNLLLLFSWLLLIFFVLEIDFEKVALER